MDSVNDAGTYDRTIDETFDAGTLLELSTMCMSRIEKLEREVTHLKRAIAEQKVFTRDMDKSSTRTQGNRGVQNVN